MTMKITEEQTIKIRRKQHPNAPRYPGRASHETSMTLSAFLSKLSPSQLAQFDDGYLVIDEDATAKFFDSILPGDVIGIAKYIEGKGLVSTCMKIERSENDILYGKAPVYPQKEVDMEVTFEQVSTALAMGFAEILMRDDKPFGVDEEVELKVRLFENQTEETVASETDSKSTEATKEDTKIEPPPAV